MKYIAVIMTLLLGLMTTHPAAAQDDEEAAKKMAAEMTRLTVIEYLEDREFKLESKELEATAEAIAPKEHVQVEALDFTLLPNHVSAKFQVDFRLGFEGTLQTDEGPIGFHGEADTAQEISIEADFNFLNGDLQVNAKVTELEFVIKIREVTPDDIPGGKERLEEVAQEEFERQHDDLLREMNDWLDEYEKNF